MPKKKTSYEECIVSFLDILGFRSMLDSAHPEKIARAIEAFRRASSADESETEREPHEIGKESVVRVETVSDAIVRARTMEARYQAGYLYWELLDLLHIQIACIANGVAVRGAVTIGDLHLGADLTGPVFGPALVRAFEMESQEVMFPRIAVEEAVLDRLRSDPKMRREGHTLEQELEYYDELLEEDSSGLRYIDYLGAALEESEDYGEYVRFLEYHKILVEKGLEDCGSNPKVRRKYNWLRNYHNRRVQAEADKFEPEEWYEEYECVIRDVLESLLLT